LFQELRNFQLTIQVPAEYHQRLIGPKGQKINQLRAKHDVQISIPKQVEGEEPNENVVITGQFFLRFVSIVTVLIVDCTNLPSTCDFTNFIHVQVFVEFCFFRCMEK
jgi:predicted PilT family ATPase